MIEKILYFIFATPAYAATVDTVDGLLKQHDRTVAVESGDILTLADSVMQRIPYILGGLAMAALLYSGFLYISAFGDATKMESAKKNITWIIMGILAVAVIFIIMNIAVKITGLEILKSSPL